MAERLSIEEKEKLEIELYNILQDVKVSEILQQIQKLKEFKEELKELEMVLQTTRCICEKLCKNKKLFCC